MSSIRRQSSLGTELRRVYEEDKNQLRLLLATVEKVNHRYNTVDVVSLSGKVRSNKSGEAEGRFSAKLPVQFAGRTIDGEPYGQTTPVDKGTMVLIGFINGHKHEPVVLSIYGDPDAQKELSRSPVTGDAGNDESMKKHTQHQFTVYPSLTYEDIDGEGNRTVSFTGYSFLTTDSDIDPDMGALTDDGDGTHYEDLESSYYYSGELIQPKNKKAPAILFRHVGNKANREGQEVADDHVTMLHLAQDGTFRMSTLKETEEWRTYFELTEDGTLRLRRQNDSKGINQGEENHELSVGRDGITFRSGDRYMIFNENGFSGNAGGLGGGDYSAEIGQLRDGILSMGTQIEQTAEYVRISAQQVVADVEGQISDFEASFEVTARQIESRVTETVYHNIGQDLQDLTDDLNRLNEGAIDSLNQLQELAEDGKLSPVEKKTLSRELDMIRGEYPGYIAQAELTEVETAEYIQAYEDLIAYTDPLMEYMDETSNINRVEFMQHFQNYFTARGNMLYNIFKELKEEIELASQTAIDAGLDALTAMQESSEALVSSRRSQRILEDIAEDDRVTPQEKRDLRREYYMIQDEWESIIAQAEAYEVNYLDFEDAKVAVDNFIGATGVFDNMHETTELNGALLVATFLDYYEERARLYSRISRTTKQVLLDFEGDLEHYETRITETAREIALVAESVRMVERDITLARAEINVQSDRISRNVTRVEMERSVDTNLSRLNNVGRNLFVRGTSNESELNPDTGQLQSGQNSPITSSYIRVSPTTDYVVSVYDSDGSNIIVVSWYDMDRNFIESESMTDSGSPISMFVESPAGARYARVSTQQRNRVRVQFEQSRRVTNYKASPEDMVADLDVAREERDSRKDLMETYDERYNELRNQGIAYLDEIEQLVDDFQLTPQEKRDLEEIWNDITMWDTTVRGEAEAYGVDKVAYVGSFQGLDEYIEPLLRDMANTSAVVRSTAVRLFRDFFEYRNRIYRNISQITRESFEASEKILDEVSESALEAQRAMEQLQAQAEQASRDASVIRTMILETSELESDRMRQIGTIVDNGVVEAENKPYIESYLSELSEVVREAKLMANTYSLSTGDIDSAYNQLSSYVSAMLTVETRREDTGVSAQTFMERFRQTYEALGRLLQAILDGANGRYEQVSEQSRIAQDEYNRRQEQMNTYNNALIDSQFMMERIQESIDDLQNAVPYRLELTSSNGIFFRDNNIYTILTARVFRGNDDITAEIHSGDFVWTKKNADGEEDTVWMNNHQNVGNEVEVTHEDVRRQETFSVELDTGGL